MADPVEFEGVWSRARRDTLQIASSLSFIVATLALGVVLGVVVAIWDPSEAIPRGFAGAVGAGLSTLVLLLVLCSLELVRAPIRQRDEARAELRHLTGDLSDPSVLLEEYSIWLAAKLGVDT